MTRQERTLRRFRENAERLQEIAQRNGLWLDADEVHGAYRLTRDGKTLKEAMTPYLIEVYLDGYETGTHVIEHAGTDTLG